MATTISWPVCTVLMFLEFGVVICSALGSRRRSRFYTRLGCATLTLVGLAVGLAFALKLSVLPQQALGLAWVVLLLASLAVAPAFCYDTFAPFWGPSEGDGDGGPGSSPPPPDPPRGGAPLPDADQARARRRDHDRPRLRGVSGRRPAVEPERPRVPDPRRR